MKKILFGLLIAAISLITVAKAQTTKKVTGDTLTNSDTAYITFTAIGSRLKAIQPSLTKLSGTVAGTVLLQGTVDGTNWVNVNTDTLTLSNTPTINTKVWLITAGTGYTSYRCRFYTSGTSTALAKAAWLRRTDD